MKFEHHREPVAPRSKFIRRMVRFTFYAMSFLFVSLMIGVAGYHYICDLGWVDAFLNASMILTGMGPVSPLPNREAKIFASAYAIFCGIAFLTIFSILIAPVLHRLLHRLHLTTGKDD